MRDRVWCPDEIGELGGRVVIVTGANSGLGLAVTRQLARHGATVVLAVRNLDKGRRAVDGIRGEHPDADVVLQHLDLASLRSVRAAADAVSARRERIDLLINNAGVMFTPRRLTDDGFEIRFGTNHLGHFAWTGLLIDRLSPVDGARVVTVASQGHRLCSRLELDRVRGVRHRNGLAAYGCSKLANLLFTYELQRRLSEAGSSTIALAAHPGGSDTRLARSVPGVRLLRPLARVLAQPPSQGALPILRAATDGRAKGGDFFGPDGLLGMRGEPVLVGSNARSHDTDLQRRLWVVSEELTGVRYPM